MLLLFGALIVAPVFAAEKIAVEVGQSFHRSEGADAVFTRYLNDLELPNLSQQGFYEISLGSWDDKDPNTALGLALGIQGHWNNVHLNGSFGVAYLANKTDLSGTHQQIISRLGAGYTVGKFDFSLFVTHYSNAKAIFGWEGNNSGYDFVTGQIGYALK